MADLTYRPYAGIGSRDTPQDVLDLMRDTGYRLACQGWTLRSGAAPGADSAFEEGAWDAHTRDKRAARPELYLPWAKFEKRRKTLVALEEPAEEAFEIASRFHPYWLNMKSRSAQALHARNAHQVLGAGLDSLSWMVVCWTKDGGPTGGTGQALRMAAHYNVPVFNLRLDDAREQVERFCEWR